jgi:sugar/nucleoside kinase (ribokinase family)
VIVFSGYANRDLTVRVPTLPGAGGRVQATEVLERDGGMGANAAVAAARVGARVHFAGVIGPGEAFRRALTAEGVDTSLTSDAGVLTTAIVLLTPDGERAIISQDDQLDVDRLAQVYADATELGADWLYLDGYRFPWAHEVLAQRGSPRRPKVLVDLDGCPSPAAALAALDRAEHAVVGRELGETLFGCTTALAAAARAHRVHLVVTDGARGWTLYEPSGTSQHGAALPVHAVDTTGAGDCFAGVYCAELDRGADPRAAAAFASAAAGLSCTRLGARDGLPDRAAVLEVLNRRTDEEPKE